MSGRTNVYFLDSGLSAIENGKLAGRVMRCDQDGNDLTTLVSDIGSMPDGIGISENHIFYTNMGNGSQDNGFIARVDLDGSNQKVIIPVGTTFTPKQLTLSEQSKKIYWCDREGMRVFCGNFDGSGVEVLIKTGEGDADRKNQTKWCVGIAVDDKRGKLYWTQKGPSKGNQGRLFAASLEKPSNGKPEERSDIKCLLDHLPEPIDLDLDHENNILYMSDRGDPPSGNSISKIHLDSSGGVKKDILVRKLHEAIGLTLDVPNNRMFFTDLSGGLYTANLDGSNEKTLHPNLGDLTGATCLTV